MTEARTRSRRTFIVLVTASAIAIATTVWLSYLGSSWAKVDDFGFQDSLRPTLTRVLFIYGSVPPGTDEADMIRLTNTGRNGYSQFADLLHEEQGHNTSELRDTDPAINPLTLTTLKHYDLIVLGSNNRRYSQAEATVLRQYVEGGGAVLALSDSRFGLSPDRSRNLPGAGEESDNDLMGQFGFHIEHDNYIVVDATIDRFVLPGHSVLHNLSHFRGEGVSLIQVTGHMPTILVRGDGLPLTDGVTITGMDYAITAIAQLGAGRVAVTFDRNTFFNAGVNSDGTDIGQFNNRQYARNLINWLARPLAPVPND
jgi:hypothetical protein